MINSEVLTEQGAFSMYRIIGRFTHTEDITVQELGNHLRAVEGVVTIIQVDHDFYKKNAIMKVKFITNKNPKVSLRDIKQDALRSIISLKRVEFAMNTMTKES
jgi:hypothetical protein